MTIALRQPFGVFAGGVEHAYALATLAHATRSSADRAPPLSECVLLADVRPHLEFDQESRLVALLQDLLAHAEYTFDDLRREGFADAVLDAARALRRLPS